MGDLLGSPRVAPPFSPESAFSVPPPLFAASRCSFDILAAKSPRNYAVPEIVSSRSDAGTVLQGDSIAGQPIATEGRAATPRNEAQGTVTPKLRGGKTDPRRSTRALNKKKKKKKIEPNRLVIPARPDPPQRLSSAALIGDARKPLPRENGDNANRSRPEPVLEPKRNPHGSARRLLRASLTPQTTSKKSPNTTRTEMGP